MVIEVKKRPGESNRSFLRRFARIMQRSGVLIRARQSRFKDKPKSRRERRAGTLKRIATAKDKEKLRKLGLLQEEPKWSRKKRY